MSGWIKIHRDIAEHWIFQDAEKLRWWMDMLFLASYENNRVNVGNRILEVERGQFLGSLSFFVKRWGVSKERVINFLRLLQSDGMIDKKSDKNITLITICNYASYQDVTDNLPDTIADHHPDNLPDNLPDTTKEGKEVKENIYSSNQRAREDGVEWDAERENRYVATFKGQGTALPLSKKLGKSAKEVMELLEIYMAHREIKNRGHNSFNEFLNLFIWHIENKKIVIPEAAPKQQASNVLTGQAIFDRIT